MADCKKIMMFGVFDILHEGHIQFFKQALQLANTQEKYCYIVVVTRDAIVNLLKKRNPLENETVRMSKIKNVDFLPGLTVVLGDTVLSAYSVIHEYRPDIICLGYDQQGLYNNLVLEMRKKNIPEIPIVMMQPYKPEIYHSSLLRNANSNC